MRDVKLSALLHFFDRQIEACRQADTHRYFLYGGARGPGKSYFLRAYSLRFLLRCAAMGLTGVRTMLGCETFPALRDRHVEKLAREVPAWLGHFDLSHFELHLEPAYGSGVICLRNLDNPDKYRSSEFGLIAIDELTMDTLATFNLLRGSLRWPGLPRTQFVAATNPNGPGAKWVRALWIEHAFPPELESLAPEFAFTQGLPADNPCLPQGYIDDLKSLPETLRRAWLEGDWYAGIEGAVFPEFGADNLTDEDIDPTRPLELAFDDGYVDPRVLLVIQRTGSRVLVAAELYHTHHLAEACVSELVDLCKDHGWPLPEIAVGSPEAKELQARLRAADIAVRTQAHRVTDGISIMRRLVCDGTGYRALQVNHRCRNFIWELTEGYQYPEGVKASDAEKPADGNDHACEAFRHWAHMRARIA